MVDTVTSLGGCPVKVDEWELDVVHSGTQKCVGCPPGLAPITFSPRAEKVLDARKTKVQSFYLDMSIVRQYWGQERFYHHTAPISMCYALREALRLLYEEGLEARWERHALNSRALMAGLQAMGLQAFAQEGYRLHRDRQWLRRSEGPDLAHWLDGLQLDGANGLRVLECARGRPASRGIRARARRGDGCCAGGVRLGGVAENPIRS